MQQAVHCERSGAQREQSRREVNQGRIPVPIPAPGRRTEGTVAPGSERRRTGPVQDVEVITEIFLVDAVIVVCFAQIETGQNS